MSLVRVSPFPRVAMITKRLANGSSAMPSEPPLYLAFRREHHGDDEPAFAAFAASVGGYYDRVLSDRPRCLFCERPKPGRVAEFKWSKRVVRGSDKALGAAVTAASFAITAVLTGGGGAHAVHGNFGRDLICTTHHAVCEACFRSWRWRNRLMALGAVLAGFIGVLACAPMGIGLLFGYFGTEIKPRERAELLSVGWAGAAVAVAGLLAYGIAYRVRAPAALRHMQAGHIRPAGARLLSRDDE